MSTTVRNTRAVTRRTAISLPDTLYREIERARRHSGTDRSTWLQEAASLYLRRRTKEAEIEAWLAADELAPASEDERSLDAWKSRHWKDLLTDPPARVAPRRGRKV